MSNQRTQDRAITLEAATNAIVKAVQDSINTTQRRVAMDTLFCLYSPNNPLLQGDNMGSLRADAALSALDEARSVGLQNVSAAWLEFVQDSIVWKEFFNEAGEECQLAWPWVSHPSSPTSNTKDALSVESQEAYKRSYQVVRVPKTEYLGDKMNKTVSQNEASARYRKREPEAQKLYDLIQNTSAIIIDAETQLEEDIQAAMNVLVQAERTEANLREVSVAFDAASVMLDQMLDRLLDKKLETCSLEEAKQN